MNEPLTLACVLPEGARLGFLVWAELGDEEYGAQHWFCRAYESKAAAEAWRDLAAIASVTVWEELKRTKQGEQFNRMHDDVQAALRNLQLLDPKAVLGPYLELPTYKLDPIPLFGA